MVRSSVTRWTQFQCSCKPLSKTQLGLQHATGSMQWILEALGFLWHSDWHGAFVRKSSRHWPSISGWHSSTGWGGSPFRPASNVDILYTTGVHRHQNSSYWDGSESKWPACIAPRDLSLSYDYCWQRHRWNLCCCPESSGGAWNSSWLSAPLSFFQSTRNCSGCQVHEQTWKSWYDIIIILIGYYRSSLAFFELKKYHLQVLLHWPANFDKKAPLPPCAATSWRSCRLQAWRGLERAQKEGKVDQTWKNITLSKVQPLKVF